MSPKRLLLIVNPKSGTSSKLGVADRIAHKLEKEGFDVRIHYTTGPGNATSVAREAADEGYYGVVACGGDGTVNEVASGLCGTRTALGIIPLGSGNGLARHLEIPIDDRAATRVVAADHIIDCDYCTVNGRPFFCTFGVGFDAVVSQNFAKRRGRGLINYLKSVIDVFVTYKPQEYRIRIADETLTEKAFLIVCCNASQYGNNAYIAPGASITDGLIDLTIVHDTNLLQNLRLGADLISGLLYKNRYIDSLRTRELTISCGKEEPVPIHIDGEPLRMAPPLNVRVHPGEIRIFVPGRSTRFIPVLTPLWCNGRDLILAIGRIFK
ncbi:MAG: diacylglycerol kinase family lipid kinase [Muribaculaceae bacterium]|nr:diacylglycerol kinase family lipid kinase [Muribaculaceae bacterium]